MLAATVTASGKLLKPMLIFKGQAHGRIERSEFQTYPDNCIYAMQPKAWMDEKIMHKWIDDVLIPWKQSRNPDIVPLLVLDAYRVHMMGSILNRIQSLGMRSSTSRLDALICANRSMSALIDQLNKR